ncbi:MAG TPA: hypothetical protein VK509_25510, partial [Polyangiales bacterium]|nr:hypothetical protein [Polyangiales bacterium]
TTPAANAGNVTAWRKWSQRYAAGVAPVLLGNGAATAPLYTITGRAGPVETVMIGGSAVAGGGSFYGAWAIEDFGTSVPFTGGLSEEAAFNYYISKQTAL